MKWDYRVCARGLSTWNLRLALMCFLQPHTFLILHTKLDNLTILILHWKKLKQRSSPYPNLHRKWGNPKWSLSWLRPGASPQSPGRVIPHNAIRHDRPVGFRRHHWLQRWKEGVLQSALLYVFFPHPSSSSWSFLCKNVNNSGERTKQSVFLK